MFAWASKLLVDCEDVANFVRWRFPAVFIDEMQDTSESQNEVLARLFTAKASLLRQRFGDPNQAIYDFGQSRATTDPFPSGDIRKVPNSKRFGPAIAKRAEPLAPVSPEPKLMGDGPQSGVLGNDFNASTMPHTIFCFGADSIHRVLPAFGRLMLDVFPDQVIGYDRFSAKAIARVGQSGADEETPHRAR
jgi:hypothetical protein